LNVVSSLEQLSIYFKIGGLFGEPVHDLIPHAKYLSLKNAFLKYVINLNAYFYILTLAAGFSSLFSTG
jgi:hypothetical protein